MRRNFQEFKVKFAIFLVRSVLKQFQIRQGSGLIEVIIVNREVGEGEDGELTRDSTFLLCQTVLERHQHRPFLALVIFVVHDQDHGVSVHALS